MKKSIFIILAILCGCSFSQKSENEKLDTLFSKQSIYLKLNSCSSLGCSNSEITIIKNDEGFIFNEPKFDENVPITNSQLLEIKGLVSKYLSFSKEDVEMSTTINNYSLGEFSNKIKFKESTNDFYEELLDIAYKVKYFYDFDDIEHFNMSEEEYISFENNQNGILNDTIEDEIIYGSKPDNITDTLFIQDLEKYGFTSMNITHKHHSINELFKDRRGLFISISRFACVHIFRDILVLKKDNKIVGVVKVCFECLGIHFIGTSSDTNWGSEEVSKLISILKDP